MLQILVEIFCSIAEVNGVWHVLSKYISLFMMLVAELWPDDMYPKLLVELWSKDRHRLLAELWPDDRYLIISPLATLTRGRTFLFVDWMWHGFRTSPVLYLTLMKVQSGPKSTHTAKSSGSITPSLVWDF